MAFSDILIKINEVTNSSLKPNAPLNDPERIKLARWANTAAQELWNVWQFPTSLMEDYCFVDTHVSHDYTFPWYYGRIIGIRHSITGQRITRQGLAPRYAASPWRQPYYVWRNTAKTPLSRTPNTNAQITVNLLGEETDPVTISITGKTSTSFRITENLIFNPGEATTQTTQNQFIFNDGHGITALSKDIITVGDVQLTIPDLSGGNTEISKIPNTQYDVWYLRWAVSDDKTLETWVDGGFEILFKHTFVPLYNDTDTFADGTYDDAVVLRVQANRIGKEDDGQPMRLGIEQRLGALLSALTKSDESTIQMEVTVDPISYFDIIRRHGIRFSPTTRQI